MGVTYNDGNPTIRVDGDLAMNLDYSQLETLLADGNWKEADRETAKTMLKLVGREKQGYLTEEDIDSFEDLPIINQLWVKYSQGRFGFSVQNRIYESLGGTRNYDSKIWQNFADRVGWRVNNKWLFYNDLTFDLTANFGHLPCGGWWVYGGGEGWCWSLLSRHYW